MTQEKMVQFARDMTGADSYLAQAADLLPEFTPNAGTPEGQAVEGIVAPIAAQIAAARQAIASGVSNLGILTSFGTMPTFDITEEGGDTLQVQ